MLDMYFTTSCIGVDTSFDYKERSDNDFNFKMYNLTEAIFWPTSRLLGSFYGAMHTQDTMKMEMKPRFYGIHDPSSNQDRKSARD